MASSNNVEKLKSLSLLSHLSDSKLQELSRFLKQIEFKTGEVIFEEGGHGDSLFLVSEGQVKIEKKVESKSGYKELALLSPGDFFGEMALIEETPRSARAIAQSDVQLFVLARKDLFSWLNAEPVMALGFFVELLRVFSQRLRNTSNELALLFDISHLVLGSYESEKPFVTDALRHILPHLEGDWTVGGYLLSPYTDEIELVGAEGPQSDAIQKRKLPSRTDAGGWVDASTYLAPMPGDKEPLGYLICQNARAMTPRDRNEASITLTTVAHLLSSALRNIAHRAEEAARARLQKQTHGSVQM